MHLAFKCTYNDADENIYVGFNGTCSVDNIIRNIKSGRVWCSNQDCACRQFKDRGFTGDPPVFPCYESELFNKWCFGGGTYHHGKRAGTPIKIHKVKEGNIVILTTLFPIDQEKDRKIIGLYKIGRIENPDQTFVYAAEEHRVRLPLEEAKMLDFWDYFSVAGEQPRWGTGLFRYLEDKSVVMILRDLMSTIRDEHTKMIIKDILDHDFKGVHELPKCMLRKNESRAKAIACSRKYGAGGEGKEHKQLKEWIAKHPEKIGVTNVRKTTVEHLFLSGDVVDILFELNDGSDVVVEIETVDPEPGCHQAIKYRSLRCAQRGIDLNSDKVIASLVAWEIPEPIAKFCAKYSIHSKAINRTL